MKKETRHVEWDRADGKGKAELAITVTRGVETVRENAYMDGDNMAYNRNKVVEKTEMTLTTAGKTYPGLTDETNFLRLTRKLPAGAKMVLNNGDVKVVVPETAYNHVLSAIADATASAETDPDWLAVVENRKELAEYEEHVRRVDGMMNLNGRTY